MHLQNPTALVVAREAVRIVKIRFSSYKWNVSISPPLREIFYKCVPNNYFIRRDRVLQWISLADSAPSRSLMKLQVRSFN